MSYIKDQFNEYFATYNYLTDLRSGKTTRSQRWSYLNPSIKSNGEEGLLEVIVNDLIWTSFIVSHPVKAAKTYFLALCELFDPSPK